MPLATYLRGWSTLCMCDLQEEGPECNHTGHSEVDPQPIAFTAKLYIPDCRDPHVTICYTLNFDLVTDAASRGFLVLACHLATPCDRRCIARFPSVSMPFGYTLNFDLVTDAASRGFLVLACHLATP